MLEKLSHQNKINSNSNEKQNPKESEFRDMLKDPQVISDLGQLAAHLKPDSNLSLKKEKKEWESDWFD